MVICNIYNKGSLHYYKNEKMVMILAHLVKKNYYTKDLIGNQNQYVIMDNGLYEGKQVSVKLIDLIKLAEQQKYKIDEIVVPDSLNDFLETKKLFMINITTMIKYKDQYRFMCVAQGKDVLEIRSMIEFYETMAKQFDLNISIGISKLTPANRDSEYLIECYKKCLYPIHFLGLKHSFKELNNVKQIIRSCDTSQLISYAYSHKNKEGSIDEREPLTYYWRSYNVELEDENDYMRPSILFKFWDEWNENR